MTASQPTCPMKRSEVVERYFLEHRAKLIDVAAFLDRLDRAASDGDGEDDFRVAALRRAIAIFQEDQPDRAKRVLELLSDHTTEPIPSAAGLKGAFGAPPPQETSGGAS